MLSTTASIVNTQCTSLLVFDYPANYKISDEDNVLVYHVLEDGQEDLLDNGPDYVLTLITDTGFNVELVTSFEEGVLSVRRETPQVQETEFVPGGDFPDSAFEGSLDRLVMMQQEMQEILNRVIMIALSDDPANLALPPADIRALKYFTFDSDGNTSVSGASGEGAIIHTDLLDMPSAINEDHDDRYLNMSGENGEQDFIDFDTSSIGNGKEGRLRWNDDDGTLNLGLKGGNVNLQIGQEMVVRAKNTSGSTIADGTPVRITGASGANPEIGLSDANDPAKAGSIGLTTEEILNNQFGYLTTFGLVRDINTLGTPVSETWSNADRLYVSDTAGKLTNVLPTGGSRIIFIGVVLRAHATEGIILVYPINVSSIEELSGNDDGSGNPILSIDTANKKVVIDGDLQAGGLITGVGAYTTGWINRSDWTDVHLGSNTSKNVDSNVNHGLGLPLKYVRVKVLISPDGTDANSFEVGYTDFAAAATLSHGFDISQVDTNNILVQTGVNGILKLGTTGNAVTIDTEDWYYNILVFPEIYRPT